jgi:hypothetical protein
MERCAFNELHDARNLRRGGALCRPDRICDCKHLGEMGQEVVSGMLREAGASAIRIDHVIPSRVLPDDAQAVAKPTLHTRFSGSAGARQGFPPSVGASRP